ncbi:MAG: hypothetical protein ABR501_06580 [Pyrinomonadaceae bacterium]
MKRKVAQFFMIGVVTVSMAVAIAPAKAQNSNTAKGEIKQSGSEVGNAAKGMGRNVRRGRIVRGGKHFGKHMGRAGKHFGRSTKKVFKRAIS